MDKGLIYAIFSVFLWSTVASAFKITLKYTDFVNLLLYSSFFSFLFYSLVLFIGEKNIYAFLENFKNSILLGFLNPFLYYLVLFKAYSLLPAQEAQSINYVWPIVLSFFSVIFLKYKVSRRNFFALFISFIGVIIISTRGNLISLGFRNPVGVLLALFSSLIWALYWILNLKDKRKPEVKFFFNFLFGFLYTLIFSLIYGFLEIPSLRAVLGSFYIGLFEMGLTFLLWFNALKHSKNISLVNNMVYFSPFLSLFFISIFVGEKILLSTIVGLLFIITGVFINRK